MTAVLSIALTAPPYAILTYSVPPYFTPEDFPKGLRLLVPVAGMLRAGVVWDTGVPPPEGVTLRPALWPLERRTVCDAAYLELVHNLACRHLTTPGRIFGSLLPRGLRTAKVLFEYDVKGLPRRLTALSLSRRATEEHHRLAALWRAGGMRCRLSEEAADPLCSLAADPPWPVRPGAAKQLAVLDLLCDQGPLPLSDIKKRLGPGTIAILRRLADLALVRLDMGPQEAVVAPKPATIGHVDETLPPLTDDQRTALTVLEPALQHPDGAARLVFGVTGSGKTRLYLELVRLVLARGKRVLLLAPEVALAAKLHRAAAQAFPEKQPMLFHGFISLFTVLRQQKFLHKLGQNALHFAL